MHERERLVDEAAARTGPGGSEAELRLFAPDRVRADAANAVAGSGVLYPQSPRQAQTEALLSSPPGYGAFTITGGYSGGGGEDWPGDVTP